MNTPINRLEKCCKSPYTYIGGLQNIIAFGIMGIEMKNIQTCSKHIRLIMARLCFIDVMNNIIYTHSINITLGKIVDIVINSYSIREAHNSPWLLMDFWLDWLKSTWRQSDTEGFKGGFNLPFINPFMPTVPTFAVRETNVPRHNGGTWGAPLKPLRDDSALRALSSLRGLRGGFYEFHSSQYSQS